MSETIIKLENVSFRYSDEVVLDKINLDIHKGEFLGIIGPNGSGKSTLLKVMLGLLKPTSGDVAIFGKNPRLFSDRSKVGYVPQKASLSIFNFPITVFEIVSLGLANSKNKDNNLVRDALNAVSMHKYKDRLISELSGGQQQKVFIARALVSKPELLVLDEPTVGVDLESQHSFYELLRNLNVIHGLTLVLVSHDVDAVSKEVRTVVCLNKKLLGHMSSEEFKKTNLIDKIYSDSFKKITHNH